MKNKIQSATTYLITITINFIFTFLLNYLFFKNNQTYFTMFGFGFVLISIIINSAIANKLGYKLDLFAYNIEDKKYLLLNDIYIGELFSIPLLIFGTMFI